MKRDAPPLVPTLSGVALRIDTHLGHPISLDATSPLWRAEAEYRFAEQFFARFNVDGTIDSSFHPSGWPYESAHITVASRENNKMVVAGYPYVIGGQAHYGLLALNENGTTDSEFTNVFAAGQALEYLVFSILGMPDGRLLVMGRSREAGSPPGGPDSPLIARLHTETSLRPPRLKSFAERGDGSRQVRVQVSSATNQLVRTEQDSR